MIYVTHDQIEALAASNNLAIMLDGKIEALGHSQDIFIHPPSFKVGRFLGATNKLPCKQIRIEGDRAWVKVLDQEFWISRKCRELQANYVIFRPQNVFVVQPPRGDLLGKIVEYIAVDDRFMAKILVGEDIVEASGNLITDPDIHDVEAGDTVGIKILWELATLV
ncbi:MAG: hypothetical protein ACUVQ8_00275 [Nitrososphaeria archaeon]